MIIGRTPFTQWEADIAVYQSDALGYVAPGAEPEWIGGWVNKSSFQDGFKTEEANVSGMPVVNLRQLEEQHTIEMENVWMARILSGPAISAPAMRRDRYYSVAIVWTDGETGVWVKRCYIGVKIPQLSMSSDTQAFLQKLRIEGGAMQQTCGVLGEQAPGEDITVFGIVRYVSLNEQTDLYTFDFANPGGGFQPIDEAALAGRAAMGPVGGGYQISVAGADGMNVALAIDGTGKVTVAGVTAIGGSYVNGGDSPRLEFYAGLSRIASLSACGELGIPGFSEADADPDISGAFRIGAGSEWLASLAPNGLYAAGLCAAA